tara:strand:- start:285 stop:728 length:444 start_codon:yes stop_codon:yes gene_type:complete
MGGGSQREEVIMPEFAETSMQQGLGMARDLAPLQDTYTPLYGPQVAALSPMEQAGIQGTDMMAGAFGMPTAGGQSYLPQAQTFEGGIQGYSARPMVEGMIEQFKTERPGQAEYRESFGLDPVTGEVGSRAPENQPVELEMQGGGGGK